MQVEAISEHNLYVLTELMLALWPDCSLKEEYANCQKILADSEQTCYLLKSEDDYIAFIQLSLRKEYVEGANSGTTVAYVEGIYVKDEFQKHGLGTQLFEAGLAWAKSKGCKQIASDAELDNQGSIAFHKKYGFREVNRIVCFIKDIN